MSFAPNASAERPGTRSTGSPPDDRCRRSSARTERGRPAAGYFTKRLAEDWLRDTLSQARRGTLPGSVRTGVTFADAAAEWLRYVEHDRSVKPSTLTAYRSTVGRLVVAFGDLPVEGLTAQRIETWRAGLGAGWDTPLSNRTRNEALTVLGGVMERARKVYGLPSNPVRDVGKLRERYDATRFEFYSPEEVHALVGAAASEQDAAIFLTAPFSGLRCRELIALHWLTTPSPAWTPSRSNWTISGGVRLRSGCGPP